MYTKTSPQIMEKMNSLVSICSDMMQEHEEYSNFVLMTVIDAYKSYAIDGKLSEENLLKYIEESIELAKKSRKVA